MSEVSTDQEMNEDRSKGVGGQSVASIHVVEERDRDESLPGPGQQVSVLQQQHQSTADCTVQTLHVTHTTV